MKIAIVGPAHPYKGGIALHTTQLAHHLAGNGDAVTIISWRAQYPFFYPGEQFVPNNQPEMPVFENTRRVLSWKNPAGWLKWGSKLRAYDKVIFIWYVPKIQGPIYRTMLQVLGKKGPEVVILCHNVLQHGNATSGADRLLAQKVFDRASRLIVHTPAQAELAKTLTKTHVDTVGMPAHLPGNPNPKLHSDELQHHLLFFGLVRKYKGVDILIRALVRLPNVSLTVAGEMWGKQSESLTQLVTELGLESRVTLRPGYVPAADISALFARADALVMPYRSGTASHTAELAFANGVPVIATRVGSMPAQIRDGVDGFLCQPDDVASLSAALTRLYKPDVFKKLRANLPTSHAEKDWQQYVKVITQTK